MIQEATLSVLARYRDFPMLGVEAWRAFLGGDDAALPDLAAPPPVEPQPVDAAPKCVVEREAEILTVVWRRDDPRLALTR